MNTAKAMRGELLIVAAIVLGLAGRAHCQSQVQMNTTIIMADHAQHAAPLALAAPQSLLEPNAVTFAPTGQQQRTAKHGWLYCWRGGGLRYHQNLEARLAQAIGGTKMLTWGGGNMNAIRAIRGEALIVLAIILGLAGYAHCQSQVTLSTTLVMADHAQRAVPASLSAPQSLLGTSTETAAHGEMPNADIPVSVRQPEVPLGTIARWYRESDNRPRATFVREIQGGRQRHDNSLGAIQYVDNPNTYLFGVIVNQPENPNRVIMDGRRRLATILTFQPYNTFNLFTEAVTFCGNLTPAFAPVRGPIVVTYKTVAHEMVNGVACHEFVDVFKVVPPPDENQ